MKNRTLTRLTGFFFMIGAIVVNIPYSLLIAHFQYPDILRQPAGEVLAAFAQGGQSLIFTWLAFAWSGLPLLLAILLAPRALECENDPLVKTATTLGVIGATVRFIALGVYRPRPGRSLYNPWRQPGGPGEYNHCLSGVPPVWRGAVG